MSEVDSWFHDQLTRIKPSRGAPRAKRAAALPLSPARRRMDVGLALVALAGGITAFVSEATSGTMRADHPFGLGAPSALFHATSMLPVNGHAQAHPAQDRNNVIVTGIAARR